MKRFVKYMMPAAVMTLLLAFSCGREFHSVDTESVPVVNKATLGPDATSAESTVKVFRGEIVGVSGFNLNLVERVEFTAGEQSHDAPIVYQAIDSLSFKVPVELDLAQSDYAHATTLNIYSTTGARVFTHPYYITVPIANATVTGFEPVEGTVGTKITVAGDHLFLVRSVTFGSETLAVSADNTPFTVTEDGLELTFAVPVPASQNGYAAGDSEVAISVAWDINSAEVTSEGSMFTLHTPAFDEVANETPYLKPEDELVLTGKNLSLIENITWGDHVVYTAAAKAAEEGDDESEEEPETITIVFPSTEEITEAEEFIASLPLEAHWSGEGDEDMTITVADDYKVNTAPDPVPVFEKVEQAEGEIAVLPLELTFKGENLNLVERMTWGECDMKITKKDETSLTAAFPAEADVVATLTGDDYVVTAKITGYYTDRKGNEQSSTAADEYSVDVTPEPVFDFKQAEGENAEPNSQITLKGQYLSSVKAVKWGGFDLTIDETTRTATSITVTLPAKAAIRETVADDVEIVANDLTALWSKAGRDDLEVTVAEKFRVDATPDAVPVPEFNALTVEEGEPGADLTLTGYNLDLVESIMWGEYELTITVKDPETIVVTFPTMDKVKDHEPLDYQLTAVYNDTETIVIASSFKINYTEPVAGPVIESVTAQDGGTENKFYLGKTVTVTGQNLTEVTAVKLGGATVKPAEATVSSLTFAVPEEGLTFETSGDYETATEFALSFVYTDGEVAYDNKVKVYPFYFYPNVTIGAQDASNRDKAFFVPDWGRVISTDEFATGVNGGYLDPYVASNTQTAANTLNKSVINSVSQYYEVPAYIFITNSSSNAIAIISPSNSASQIRNHRTSDGQQLPSGYGTPVVGYRNIEYSGANTTETTAAEKAHEGTVESVGDIVPRLVSSGAPQFDDKGEANNRFKSGQVILVQHMSYEAGAFSSKALTDVHRGGMMIIKDMTDIDGTTGAATTTITFDFYWSKELNNN